jgi:hypothetical protein
MMGKQHNHKPEEDDPIFLDMSFDEALQMLLDAPLPEEECKPDEETIDE